MRALSTANLIASQYNSFYLILTTSMLFSCIDGQINSNNNNDREQFISISRHVGWHTPSGGQKPASAQWHSVDHWPFCHSDYIVMKNLGLITTTKAPLSRNGWMWSHIRMEIIYKSLPCLILTRNRPYKYRIMKTRAILWRLDVRPCRPKMRISAARGLMTVLMF